MPDAAQRVDQEVKITGAGVFRFPRDRLKRVLCVNLRILRPEDGEASAVTGGFRLVDQLLSGSDGFTKPPGEGLPYRLTALFPETAPLGDQPSTRRFLPCGMKLRTVDELPDRFRQ